MKYVTSPVEGRQPRSGVSGHRPRTRLPQARSVLAVTGRPGDESYYLGAVLESFRGCGAKVGLLVLSLGEASPYNGSVERLESIRSFEFELAAFVLRAAHRRLIDYPDGGLAAIPMAERTERVAGMISDCSADLLLTADDGTIDPPLVEAVCAAGVAAGIPVLAWTLPADVAAAVRGVSDLNVPKSPPGEIAFAVRVSRKVQQRAMRAHRSQADAEANQLARFDVQGDREWLRWLVPPAPRAKTQGR